MPIAGSGWELLITRADVQERRSRLRTVGSYQVYHDGALQQALDGTSVETKGPGDNQVEGNGRRIEAGAYPLATQDGSHYVTIGYLNSSDPDQTPKPSLKLIDTGNRVGVLIHPGHGFLASIGCINLTSHLADGDVDVPFVDSRKRVIAVIDDLRTYTGRSFPHHNGHRISDAFVIVDGEP